jgi:serine/threonine protein phosphatase 1
LYSYGGDPANIPPEHVAFLKTGLPYWETETDIFVHANLQPGVPLRSQTPQWLRWTHMTGMERPHESGKRVICGHTPQSSGLPGLLDGWVCLDTHAYGGRFLTCLDVTSGELYQAKQSGFFRYGLTLADLA